MRRKKIGADSACTGACKVGLVFDPVDCKKTAGSFKVDS
jgi:hypothetical protein